MGYITIQEVRSVSSFAKKASECDISTMSLTESVIFNTFLKPLKPILDSERIDYTNSSFYSSSTNYVSGDVVNFNGVYFKALKNNTAISPKNYEYWENAPMFKMDCLNSLWCDYIMPYIAHSVVVNDAPLLTAAAASSTGSGRDYVSTKMIEMYAEQSQKLAELAYSNLVIELQQGECIKLSISPSCKEEKEKPFEGAFNNQTLRKNTIGNTKFY